MSVVTERLAIRMGSARILFRQTVRHHCTMLNFNGDVDGNRHGDGMCKQTFVVSLLSLEALYRTFSLSENETEIETHTKTN